MARIFLIGVGPLPFCNVRWPLGPGQRTWQFAKPLLAAGHTVFLVTLEFGQRDEAPEYDYAVDPKSFGNLELLAIPEPDLANLQPTLERLREPLERFQPDAVVSAGNLMSGCVAAHLPTDAPLWIDIDGSVPAELQAVWVHKPDLPVRMLYDRYRQMLERGDVFSAVGHPQRHSVLGELAMLGRLNPETYGHELVHRLPIAVEDGTVLEKTRDVLDGSDAEEEALPADAYVVLWSGGFNTWADVDTLFAGLERAMADSPRVHFVATGGGIRGHYEEGYERFAQRVAGSGYRDRFHLRGWVPTGDVASYYFAAHVGINVDHPIVESDLGSRKRLLAFMTAGLPVVTTVTCELQELMEAAGVCYTAPTRDPEALAAAILAGLNDPEERSERGRRAREYVLSEFTFTNTTRSLVAWCDRPKPAPDRDRDRTGFPATPVAKESPEKRKEPSSPEARAKRKRRFRWLGLLLILGLAAGMRIWGNDYGAKQHEFRPDEYIIVNMARDFFLGQEASQPFLVPPGHPFSLRLWYEGIYQGGRLTGNYNSREEFAGKYTRLSVKGRFLSALMGTFICLGVYLVLSACGYPVAGLVGALFYAVAPAAAREAHFAMTDTGAAFWGTFALVAGTWAMTRRQPGWWLVAGALAGLAAASKPTLGLVAPALLIAVLWAGPGKAVTRILVALGTGALSLVAFALWTPGIFTHFDRLVQFVRDTLAYTTIQTPVWFHHLFYNLPLGVGTPVFILGILGIALCLWRGPWRNLRAVLVFVALFLPLMLMGNRGFVRYTLPLLPWFCLFAGLAVSLGADLLRRLLPERAMVEVIAAGVVVWVVLQPLGETIALNTLLTRTDSRSLLSDWIRDQYPDGVRTIWQDPSPLWTPTALALPANSRLLSLDRFPPETFRVLRTSALHGGPPTLLIDRTHPLYNNQPLPLDGLEPVAEFAAFDEDAIEDSYFDLLDYFFVPLSNLGAVERPGPNLRAYRVAEHVEPLPVDQVMRPIWALGQFPGRETPEGEAEMVLASVEALQRGETMAVAEREWEYLGAYDPYAFIDLSEAFGPQEECRTYVAYAVRTEESFQCDLHFGGDDSVVIWFNGEKVYEEEPDRAGGAILDRDYARVFTREGRNVVVACIRQHGYGYGIYLRLGGGNRGPFLRGTYASLGEVRLP